MRRNHSEPDPTNTTTLNAHESPAPQTDDYPPSWRFQAGSWAALLALLPGFALAAYLSAPPPIEPLTDMLVQVTPLTLASVLLNSLGPLARPLGLIGGAAICLPLGGVLALLAPAQERPARESRRRWWLRWTLTEAMGALAVSPLALLAYFPQQAWGAWLSGALFAPALWQTRRWYARLRRPDSALVDVDNASSAAPARVSRRAVLRHVVDGSIVGASFLIFGSFNVWSAAIGSLLGRGETTSQLFRYTPPGARIAGFPVAGVEPEVSPATNFYVVSKNAVDPTFEAADWTLRISGLVQTPLSVAYSELLALPRQDQYVTLRCVDNLPASHLMSNAYWSGVPLASLLNRAEVLPRATAILTRAPDGYAETLPLEVALHPTTLLAYGMNGSTLLRRHGGPVRLLAPGYYGFKNVKWIEEISLVTEDTHGYWAQRGWTAARVHAVARIDVWRPTSEGLLIAGVAYAGADGVSAVQVQLDDGGWREAVVNLPALSAMSWALWRATLPVTTGQHTVSARVIDSHGHIQPPGSGQVFPDGASGYDSVTITLGG